MYNIGAEKDKIVLLQSSLLLGFWHSETDQHVQPWYWTGISVGLCQILGLHRNPDATRRNSAITDQQRHLWRRLWWTCFFRDRWLSLTLGRPMRIDLSDCDVPMASAADLQSDVAGIPPSTAATFIPPDLPWMAQHWVTLIKMSKILGAVLKLNYQTLRDRPSLARVEALEAEIMLCHPPADVEPGLSCEAVFYVYHLQLHYQFVSFLIGFPGVYLVLLIPIEQFLSCSIAFIEPKPPMGLIPPISRSGSIECAAKPIRQLRGQTTPWICWLKRTCLNLPFQ